MGVRVTQSVYPPHALSEFVTTNTARERRRRGKANPTPGLMSMNCSRGELDTNPNREECASRSVRISNSVLENWTLHVQNPGLAARCGKLISVYVNLRYQIYCGDKRNIVMWIRNCSVTRCVSVNVRLASPATAANSTPRTHSRTPSPPPRTWAAGRPASPPESAPDCR